LADEITDANTAMNESEDANDHEAFKRHSAALVELEKSRDIVIARFTKLKAALDEAKEAMAAMEIWQKS